VVEDILELKDVSYTYPDGTKALKKVSLKIKKGGKIAVLGPNGAGKSTLFLNLNGVFKPTSGKIFFEGKEVSHNHSALKELRKKVGIVFQDPDTQLFSASVLQEVSFGPLNLKLPEDIVQKRVENALCSLDIFHLKDRPTHFLSYGQKKKVSIADIIACEPQVIIFDEPTAYLDPKHSLEMIKLMEEMSQKGTTVILSTHDVDLAYSWADYVFVMKEGKIIKEGTPLEIFSDEKLLGEADLVQPLVLLLYKELLQSAILDEKAKIPQNKEELVGMIRTLKMGIKEDKYARRY